MEGQKFTLQVYEQRVRDILKRHRMPQDVMTDVQEILQARLPPAEPSIGEAIPNEEGQ